MSATYLLEVDPMDLGPDVKAVGLELIEPRNREPVRGSEGATIWAHSVIALAGNEPWAMDFFSHLERVREYCKLHQIEAREAATRSLVIPAVAPITLAGIFERFEGETFGLRAGAAAASPDTDLEGELSRHGVDGYHGLYTRYFFCGVCDFENGFLTLLTNRLWASEVVRRLTPAFKDLPVRVQVPV